MRRFPTLSAVLLAAAVSLAPAGAAHAADVEGFTTADIEPSFSLIDHTGAPVTLESYGSAWKLVYFGYTNCILACPTAVSELSEAHRLLEAAEEGPLDVEVLFVDFDTKPEHIQALAGFVDNFPGVTGLAGDRRQMREAGRHYKIRRLRRRPLPGEIGKQFHHTTRITLIAPDNRVAAFLREDAPGPAMAEAVLTIALEEEAGTQ